MPKGYENFEVVHSDDDEEEDGEGDESGEDASEQEKSVEKSQDNLIVKPDAPAAVIRNDAARSDAGSVASRADSRASGTGIQLGAPQRKAPVELGVPKAAPVLAQPREAPERNAAPALNLAAPKAAPVIAAPAEVKPAPVANLGGSAASDQEY